MGVGSRTKAWRFTDINKDYSVSGTNLPRSWAGAFDPLVALSNISCAFGSPYQDQRCNTSIRGKVPQQSENPGPFLFALGKFCKFYIL